MCLLGIDDGFSGTLLGNEGKLPLQMVEVQVGDYLEEDDIERFDDVYGRMN